MTRSLLYSLSLGPIPLEGDQYRFTVWAPRARSVELMLLDQQPRCIAMRKLDRGYFQNVIDDVHPGATYSYVLDGGPPRPDPASRFQPYGVHGPSQIVDQGFDWTDQTWHGLPLQQFIIYELHIGTFTQEGTFDAVIHRLEELKELGVTALELMPVSQFPGTRNWGYDGVYPFAVQNSYGGPDGLRRLVNQCHQHGLAVVLDVVYNHLGPEGNCLAEFGFYFTDKYRTPWGDAINFDAAHSDEVRYYFIENALHWFRDYHIDALRLDAVHAIHDESASPFLRELTVAVHHEAHLTGRSIYLIEENDNNDARHVLVPEIGGYGINAVWNDDFHHSLHTVLTGEKDGYYKDFGSLADLLKTCREGFVYSGQYSEFRQRRHGVSSAAVPAERLVVFSQNHDQVGNRLDGQRLNQLVMWEQSKLAAAFVLLAPCIPLLFMGEEYGETSPFLYFVDHSDPDLVEAVRCGRQQEFAAFDWQEEIPDPQAAESFEKSRLNHSLIDKGNHLVLRNFYRELIGLRKEIPAFKLLSKEHTDVVLMERQQTLMSHRWSGSSQVIAMFCFADAPVNVGMILPPGRWHKVLDSADKLWAGDGATLPDNVNGGEKAALSLQPMSCAVYEQQPGSGTQP